MADEQNDIPPSESDESEVVRRRLFDRPEADASMPVGREDEVSLQNIHMGGRGREEVTPKHDDYGAAAASTTASHDEEPQSTQALPGAQSPQAGARDAQEHPADHGHKRDELTRDDVAQTQASLPDPSVQPAAIKPRSHSGEPESGNETEPLPAAPRPTSSQSTSADVSDLSDSDTSADAVAENADGGTAVGVAAFATDADATDDVTYTLIDDAGGRFVIDPVSGVVSVADGATLDYETDTSHTIRVGAQSADGSTSEQDFTVQVTDVNEGGSLTIDPAGGAEDQAIALTIGLGDLEPGATDVVTISGLPDGALLSAGTDHGDGSWTLTPDQLTGLQLTPPADSDADFSLRVELSSAEGGQTVTVIDELPVTVQAVADTPTLTVSAGAPVVTDTGHEIPVSVDGSLGDLDGSESLTFTVSGLPDGVTLSGGAVNGDGSWSLTAEDLPGLVARVPEGTPSFDLQIDAVATETDNADTASSSDTVSFTAHVSDLSDSDTSADAVAENADGGTAVGVAAFATDADATDDVTYTLIDDAGGRFVIDPVSGVVSVADGATLDYETDTSHTIRVGAQSADGSTSEQDFTVQVTDVNEGGSLTIDPAGGAEDQAIALTIGLGDLEPGATDVVTISGLPDGALLSAGTDHGDGSWTLTPDQLTGLQLTPPADSDADFSLRVELSSAEGGQTVTVIDELPVTVQAVADTPTLTVSAGAPVVTDTGHEIPVSVDGSLGDLDGSESLTFTVSGLPDGVTLSGGAVNGDGSWSLTAEDLPGLVARVPEGTPSFDLQIDAVATETDNADTASSSDTVSFTAHVSDLSDSDTSADAVAENADGGTAVGVAAFATDADATDDVTYTLIDDAGGRFVIDPVSGVVSVADGATLDYETDTSHTIRVGAQSADGSTSEQDFTVQVTDVNEGGSLTIDPAGGAEDQAIALTIGLGDLEPGATDVVTISGLPDGALLSAGTDHGDGSWTLTPDQLTGLQLTPPADSDADFSLRVELSSAEGGQTVTVIDELPVTVQAVADTPTLTVSAGAPVVTDTGHEIPVSVDGSLGDLDGSESLTFTVSGLPDGVTLSGGAVNGDGSWSLTAEDLPGLVARVPEGTPSFDLQIDAVATETDNADTASSSDTVSFTAHVSDLSDSDTSADAVAENADGGTAVGVAAFATDADATDDVTYTLIDDAGGRFVIDPVSGVVSVADGATLDYETDTSHTIRVGAQSADGSTSEQDFTVQVTDVNEGGSLTIDPAGGAEDQAIALTIGLGDLEPGATDVVTISGLPDGALLSAGTDHGDGSWTLTPDQLTGLQLTPPADSDADFSLRVELSSAEGGQTVTVIDELPVTVQAVADTPTLTVSAGAPVVTDTGHEIPVSVDGSLGDLDGSESLTFTVSGLPDGVTLSGGAVNGDGSWSLTAEDLPGLVARVPEGTPSFDLQIDAVATETDNADTASSSDTVSFTAHVSDLSDSDTSADAVAENADGGTAVGVAAFATDADATDDVTYTLIDDAGGRFVIDPVSGVVSVADGATLDYETDTSHTIRVGAQSADGSTSEQDFTVQVTDVNEGGSLTIDPAGGAEDQAIALTIGLGDLEPGATDVVTISGLPDGALLSAGTDHGDGSWTLTPDQLTGLQLTPPADSDADFSLRVELSSAEGGQTVTVIDELPVTVQAVADTPTLTVSAGAPVVTDTGHEIPVSVDGSLGDLDGSESLTFTVSGLPDGVTLSGGAVNGDGSWSLTAEDLPGLVARVPEGTPSFDLQIDAVATETDNADTASSSDTVSFTAHVSDLSDSDTSADAVAENADGGTAVGVAAFATDADATDDVTYTLIDDAGGRFVIDPVSGVVSVADGATLDYETDTSHTIRVGAQSADGSTSEQDFTVQVTDVNEHVPGLVLVGTSGEDHVIGTAGDDFIDGGRGNDTLEGGGGDDQFYVYGSSAGTDQIDGGDGYDVIQGSRYNDVINVESGLGNIQNVEAIDGGDGYDRIQGGAGDDTLDFSSGPALSSIEEIDGGYGDDHIIGTAGDDFIEGNRGNDTLEGGGGDDQFYVYGSSAGTDQIDGGDGYDVIQGSRYNDVINVESGLGNIQNVEAIDGGGGYDRIQGGAGDDTLDFSSGPALSSIEEIDGGYGDDHIIGTAGDDFIEGNRGNDTLEGGGGDDQFYVYGSSAGTDQIDGGDGYDVIQGSRYNDVINVESGLGNIQNVEAIDGGGGYDRIQGGAGDDTLDFSSGPALSSIEEIDGGYGDDHIIGTAGDDFIEGNRGNDTLEGGGGDDQFYVYGSSAGTDQIDGGDGYDVIQGSRYNDVINVESGLGNIQNVEAIDGGGGYDRIQGGAGNDTLDFSSGPALSSIEEIDGGYGDDHIIGTAGDDFIEGNRGNDTLEGGGGDDQFYVYGSSAGTDQIDGGDGYDVIQGSRYNDVINVESGLGNIQNVEAIDGGGGYDRIQGGAGDDTLDFSSGPALSSIEEIDGGYGDDHIIGTAGDDFIEGNRGNDTLEGGGGDDQFYVYGSSAGTDQIDGGDGYDVIQGSRYNDVINVESGLGNIQNVEAIDGGDGYDRIQGGGGDDTLDFSSGPALSSIEEIDGGYGDDHIIGTAGDDFIEGNRGNDTLEGGGGDDQFYVYGSSAGTDQIDGGDGYDVIQGSRYNDVINVESGLGNIQNVEAIDGGDGYDRIQGGAGNDTLDFSSGPALSSIEEIDGGYGDDHIIGTAGDDFIEGNRGNDTLEGGGGYDSLYGGSGDDQFDLGMDGGAAHGEAGNDVLFFEMGGGSASFDGGTGGGWTDAVNLNAPPTSDGELNWTLAVDGEEMDVDSSVGVLDLAPDTNGVITFNDGSELLFEGVERIEW